MELKFAVLLFVGLLFAAGILTFLYYVFFAIHRRVRKEFCSWTKHGIMAGLSFGFGMLCLAILFLALFVGSDFYYKETMENCQNEGFFDVAERQEQAAQIISLQGKLFNIEKDLNVSLAAFLLFSQRFSQEKKGWQQSLDAANKSWEKRFVDLNKKYFDLKEACLWNGK
jgi:hypothetical protein